MRKIYLFLFFFVTLLLLIINSKNAWASNDFQLSDKATYTVYENGTTHVVFNINLINTSSKFFASSYSLNPGISDIKNLSAADQNGTIIPKLINGGGSKSIFVNFRSRAAGFGKKLPFTIAFDTTDVAKKEGKIWEITIPGLSKSNDYSDFNASVNVPASFGYPSYIKPESGYQNIEYQTNTFLFSKNQLEQSEISMGFGNQQIYSFSLIYHIKNNNSFPITTQIALPPSTDYQNVSINSISKKSENVIIDKDGNWLARYFLNPSQKENITVKGSIELFLSPQTQYAGNLSDYLKNDPNWQSDNPKIREIAKKLKTPKAIYLYVVKTLHYDFSRVLDNKPRLGALTALENPDSAVCLEFTDLFIALARAVGIPSREIDGFAYTTNVKQRPLSLVKDVLHAWPEYFDYQKKQWIMVDPTWGNTTSGVDYFNTMDFDHVAFAIRGESSVYPIPAGGYKIDDAKNEKDIYIKFGKKYYTNPSKFDLTIDTSRKYLSEFPINGSLIIENTQGNLLPPQTIDIISDYLLPKSQVVHTSDIAPYGKEILPFYLKSPKFLTTKISSVRITTNGKIITRSIGIVAFSTNLLYLGGIIFAIFIIFLLVIAAKAWNLSIFG